MAVNYLEKKYAQGKRPSFLSPKWLPVKLHGIPLAVLYTITSLIFVYVVQQIGETLGSITLLIAGIASPAIANLPEDTAFMTLLQNGTVFLGVWLSFWLCTRFYEKRKFSYLGFLKGSSNKMSIIQRLSLGVIVAIVSVSLLFFINWIFGLLTITAPVNITEALGTISLLFVFFVIQAVAEEIICRGWLQQRLTLITGLAPAIVLQAMFFSFMHGANANISFLPFLNIFLVGCALGLWSTWEGTIWGVCAFHIIWNWTLGAFYGVSTSGSFMPGSFFNTAINPHEKVLLSGGDFGFEGGIILTVLLLAIIVWLYPRAKAAYPMFKEKPQQESKQLIKNKK